MNNMSNVNVMSELEITKAALAVGWVKFSYYKADGTKRVAVGTTNRALIDQVRGYRMAEYRENKRYYENCGYFDLTRGDWRQFNPNRFIGLELSRLTNEDAVKIAITISYADAHNSGRTQESREFCNLIEIASLLVGEIVVGRICSVLSGSFTSEHISEREIDDVIAVLHISATAEPTAKPTTDRDALIAELKKLRQRESEILAILLG